jgi:hypothetical protein
MQGPMSEESDPVYGALLELTRPMMLVAAIYDRRPSLMARPEWGAVTIRTLHGAHRSSLTPTLACLLDSLAQIPTLYHERDALVSRQSVKYSKVTGGAGGFDTSAVIRELLDRSQILRCDIHLQRTQWETSSPESIASTTPSLCNTATQFYSLQDANAFTLCNALLILVDQFIISLYDLLPTHDIDMAAKESASAHISTAVVAIVQSIDYHLPFTHPSTASIAGASGPSNFYLLFPIRVAHRILSQSESPKDVSTKLWLDDVLAVIKGRAGPWMSNEKIFTPQRIAEIQV